MPSATSGPYLDTELTRQRVRATLFGGPVAGIRLGRFIVKRRIGRGGLGVVYQAWDTERHQDVALKMLSDAFPGSVYRLKREFRALAEVDHPCLIKLYELFQEDGCWFFTMELVEGQYVTQWVRHGEHLDLSRLQSALSQLLEGLAALHDAGKVHCDLKPSNILVRSDGSLVILDFGLATDIAQGGAEGAATFAGTPAYMAPERLFGGKPTPAADLYSVGAVLFDALEGRTPNIGERTPKLRSTTVSDARQYRPFCVASPAMLVELCARLLERDPALRPSLEQARAALGSIGQASAGLAALPPSGLFVGRESELRELEAALAETRAGMPVAIMIAGDSGVGKTALLERFMAGASNSAVALSGRCYAEEAVPFKAFDSIVDSLARYLSELPDRDASALLPDNVDDIMKLFPGIARVRGLPAPQPTSPSTSDARELRNRGFAALKEVFARIARARSLVIAVDDAQRADLDSALLFSHLFGHAGSPPVLWIWVYRSDESVGSMFVDQLFQNFTIGRSLRRMMIQPLLAADARRLSQILLNGETIASPKGDLTSATEELAESLAAETRGVPLFIHALANHLRITGELIVEGASFDHMLTRHLRLLPDASLRLLHVFCVAAGPLETAVAGNAAGLRAFEREKHLRSLRSTRLLRSLRADEVDFAEPYHDRIREVIVASLSRDYVRHLNRAIAEALEAKDVGDVERLVEYFANAGDRSKGCDAAIQAAARAGSKLAFNRAAALYSKAIELSHQDDPRWSELHADLAQSLANAGKGALAGEAYLLAAAGRAGVEHHRLRCNAAQQLVRAGRLDQGLRLGAELLQELGVPVPGSRAWVTISRVAWLQMRLLLRGYGYSARTEAEIAPELLNRIDTIGSIFRELGVMVDPLRGTELLSRYLLLALEAGEPTRVLQGLCWQIMTLSWIGERVARDLQTRLTRLVEQLDTPYARAMSELVEAAICTYTGRYRRAMAPAQRAEKLFRECPGTSWEAAYAAFLRYNALEFAGSIRELASEAAERMREAAERDDRFCSQLMLMSIPYVHLANGAPEQAIAFLDAQQLSVEEFNTFTYLEMVRRSESYLYMGDPRRAFEYFSTLWPKLIVHTLYQSAWVKSDAHYYRARFALALYFETHESRFRTMTEQDARLLERSTNGHAGAGVAIRAMLAEYDGERSRALKLLDTAAERCEQDEVDRYATCVRHRTGQLMSGEAGAVIARDSSQRLRNQGIRDPERWVATWLPRPAK